jgi:hypothetical protein
MRNLFTIVLLILSSLLRASPSVLLEYSLELRMAGDTLVRLLSVRGLAGDDGRLLRNRFDFNPDYQSLVLLDAGFGFPGAPRREPPEWAVDTLSGGGGHPRSLAVALPGLLPGMEVTYLLETRDWSPVWATGPWLLFDPADLPDIEIFSAVLESSGPALDYSGEGYHGSTVSSRRLTLTAEHPSDILWAAAERSWNELATAILARADSVSSAPRPPDLRGAVIEAAAAGADPMMAADRARTLLTESFVVLENPPGWGIFSVSDLQMILDRRTATPLEMAVLLEVISEELGLEAEILPVSSVEPLLPLPAGWTRFLVRITDGTGRSMLLEPSARLVQSGYIHAPDTLYILSSKEGRILLRPPNTAMENMCREFWTIDPGMGTFTLELDCRGYFDMVLRRKFAGLAVSELPAALSAWIWRGGVVLVPDSVFLSDLYDLSEPATLYAKGRLTTAGTDAPFFIRSPSLVWEIPPGMGSDLLRSWNARGNAVFPDIPGTAVEHGTDSTLLTDSSGTTGIFLFMILEEE